MFIPDHMLLMLLQVRDALGASQVVRLCSSWDSGKVVAAAHRLLQHAPSIRAGVDLSGDMPSPYGTPPR